MASEVGVGALAALQYLGGSALQFYMSCHLPRLKGWCQVSSSASWGAADSDDQEPTWLADRRGLQFLRDEICTLTSPTSEFGGIRQRFSFCTGHVRREEGSPANSDASTALSKAWATCLGHKTHFIRCSRSSGLSLHVRFNLWQ